jgi:hypothetical protein
MNVKPPHGTDGHKAWMVREIHRVATELGVPVGFLTRKQFLDNSNATRTDIDACANWGAIRFHADEMHRTEAPERGYQAERRSVQHANTHRRALERQIGDVEYISGRLHSALADAVVANPPVISKLNKPKIAMYSPARREIVAVISDTHFGQFIDPEEVIGQRYNWQIAARRMARFAHQISTYKESHRKGTALRLILNGDIIEGKIHNDDNGVDMLASQMDGARQILTSLIDYLRHFFEVIYVECTPGNHGRWPFKGPGRATAQKYDSAATTIYRGIEAIFRGATDVVFNIPKTPYNSFKLCGVHRAFVTHGDTVFHAGSPGKSVNVERLTRQIFTLDASRVLQEPVAVTILGHYHVPLWSKLENGSDLVINGCGSGLNAYAQSIGIFGGKPIQVFFESTDEHAVGDFRMVDLTPADEETLLDEIIPTPSPLGVAFSKVPAHTTDFYAMAQEISRLSKR